VTCRSPATDHSWLWQAQLDRQRSLSRRARAYGAEPYTRRSPGISSWPTGVVTVGARLADRMAEQYVVRSKAPANKRMQLTKLRAAPVLQAEVPPCAPAGEMDGGTASQLIRSVGPAWRWCRHGETS
jgi:hypothetical protein